MSDEEYFKDRMMIEDKHYFMTSQWIYFFNPKRVLDIGCGAGHFVKSFHDCNIIVRGFDKSKWVIKNTPHVSVEDFLKQGDITEGVPFDKSFDLVLAIDILEHLSCESDLDKALINLSKASSKHVLISVPVIGDPNLEADPTHLIKESREWWIKKFENIKGFVLIDTPEWFYYYEQLFILKVKE